MPAFCRVAATLTPTPDSEIKNQKSSGFRLKAGTASYAGTETEDGADPFPRRPWRPEYSKQLRHRHDQPSDMTARAEALRWGIPKKLIDFGYRATHEMTVAAKEIIHAYYGESPKLSYFVGCSAGGRQGFMEAQRFPEDYDGIVAGAPGLYWSGRALLAMWIAQAEHRDEASYVPPAKYRLIHDAVLSSCDAMDGVTDGVLENPMRCKFDPKVLECKGSDTSNCLTPPQMQTVRSIFSTPVDPHTGKTFFPGLAPGSELGWATMGGPRPLSLGFDLFRYVVFKDADWDFQKLDFKNDVPRTLKASTDLDALDPDLKKFSARGGRLIQYHGWSDPQISPITSVEYYQKVLAKMGAKNVPDFYRLFMVPGMAHCGGGDGTSTFDMLPALENWVEHKKAPEQIAASRVRDGKTDRTRPLCPFPQVATYKGGGSTDEAASFTCAVQ